MVKRVLFRTGHVKRIPMGFLGQTGLMQPMRITWHVNQVHLKHASRNVQASTAAGVLQKILIQRLDCGKVFFRSSFRHISATSLQQLTSDDRAQPQFSRPRAQVLHLMAAVIGWRTSPWIECFQSLEPNEPHICSH